MHKLRNGSQATERPAAKPVSGSPGWFTESGDDNKPSFPGADWFNHNIAEFQNALAEMGIPFNPDSELNLASLVTKIYDHATVSSGTHIMNIDAIARIGRATQFDIAGSLVILSDSIGDGEGATSLEKSFPRLVQYALSDVQAGGYGADNEVIFNWTSMGNVALSGQTAGNSGPIQRSQIIGTNGTITVIRSNATKIAFYFDRTPTSGMVEIRQNGVLLSTIDCSGTARKTVLSEYTNIVAGGASVQFKVINNPVEFLAIVPIKDNSKQPNITMNMRMAVAGFNSSDFLVSPDQLVSIGECGAIGGADSIYVLAFGTNDIYTSARTPTEFVENLRTIGETLQSFRQSNVIVLTVPLIADETIFPPAISGYTHADYKDAIYKLGFEKKWVVVDHSNLRFKERNLYIDGIHPNDRGHQILATNLLYCLGMTLKKPLSGVISEAIAAKSDSILYRKRADLTTFTGTTIREKTLTSFGVTSSDFITGIYLKWKSSGVMIPIEHVQNFTTGKGIQVLRSFSGAEYSVAKLFYSSPANDGAGFANPQGPLLSSITEDETDVEVIVEFIRSSKIT